MTVEIEFNSEKFAALASYAVECEENEKTLSKRKHVKRKVAAFDFETDPFLYGRVPRPFCAGIAISENDGVDYHQFWGDDCVAQLIKFLWAYPEPLKIYAHNGGKFDFVYLLQTGLLEGQPRIINGRIVEAKLDKHVLRDSFAIIPVALGQYQKDTIDYNLFEVGERDDNKIEILKYLKSDCIYLLDLVEKFLDRFGDNLTVGSLAIKKLQEFHPFERINETADLLFRKYYFGGRVQCFKTGALKGAFKVYDVNSMYPAVMSQSEHIIGSNALTIRSNFDKYIDIKTGKLKAPFASKPYFIKFTGTNKNAIPTRDKDGALDFSVENGSFNSCSHEVKVALKYGLIVIEEIEELIIAQETIKFDEYVNTYISDKISAKENGDKAGELFAKLLLNSAYGKTAQNPANYYDWLFCEPDEYSKIIADNKQAIKEWEIEHGLEYIVVDGNWGDVFDVPPPKFWELEFDYGEGEIWKRPLEEHKYYDVAIGASVTSAARAVLLEAIINADNPIYCDTDSIICDDLNGADLHPTRLGAWDLEATGNDLYIYGKKVYALYDGEKLVKKACKGVNLEGEQIVDLCNGLTATWENQAPTFKLGGGAEFVQRILGAEKHSKLFDKFGDKKEVEK